jgi:hypothetical protein
MTDTYEDGRDEEREGDEGASGLLEQQEGKGYGEDEGERDEALEEEDTGDTD